jgi:hypothetical protein
VPSLPDLRRIGRSWYGPVELPELRANLCPAPVLGLRRGQPRQRRPATRRRVGVLMVRPVEYRIQAQGTEAPTFADLAADVASRGLAFAPPTGLSLDPPHELGDRFRGARARGLMLWGGGGCGSSAAHFSAACPGVRAGDLGMACHVANSGCRDAVTGSGLVSPPGRAARRLLRRDSSIGSRGASLRAGAG